MAGAWTTLAIKDGAGASKTMRAWDESGSGSGPFSFAQESLGSMVPVSGTVTRPNDTAIYAIGDLIANSTTAGSVVPITLAIGRVNDATAVLRALRLSINDSVWKAATIRVHLFRDTPTVSVGDNGVLNNAETYAFSNYGAYFGWCDIAIAQQDANSPANVMGFGVRPVASEWNCEPSAGTPNIFALLEARTAVTPAASKVFTLTAETWPN